MEDDKYPGDVVKNIRREDRAVILELTGEIDVRCSKDVRDKLMELLREKPDNFIVNMTDVEFMDSSGLATLVEALQWRRREGGQIKLVGLQKRVRSIFEISRLESIFEIYDNEAEALA